MFKVQRASKVLKWQICPEKEGNCCQGQRPALPVLVRETSHGLRPCKVHFVLKENVQHVGSIKVCSFATFLRRGRLCCLEACVLTFIVFGWIFPRLCLHRKGACLYIRM